MNKQLLDHIWDEIRQRYGVYLRILDTIPEDRFHTNPVEGMRTPAELMVHTSRTIVRDIAQGIAKGEVTADESKEDAAARALNTKQEILDFAKECWVKADGAMESVSEDQLKSEVPTPWNFSPQGRVLVHILNEEFLHHRAQLTVFARVCGETPPMIWGFGENAPEFQPRPRT